MIAPLYDRIILKPINEPTKSKGGVFIPESALERPSRAEVVAVGPGKRNIMSGEFEKPQVKVGDVVVFGRSGVSFKEGDQEYLIISESDVLAVVAHVGR